MEPNMTFIRDQMELLSAGVAALNTLLHRLSPPVPAVPAASPPTQPTEPAPEADWVNIGDRLNLTMEEVGRMEAAIAVWRAHGSPPAA